MPREALRELLHDASRACSAGILSVRLKPHLGKPFRKLAYRLQALFGERYVCRRGTLPPTADTGADRSRRL